VTHKDDDANVGTAAKPSNPVTLRLGELEPFVTTRMGDTAAAGGIVKRDLGRYYALLADGLRQTYLTLPEAEAVVIALQRFDAASIRYLWAEIERQYLANDEDPDRQPYDLPEDLDAAVLVDKLRDLSLHQAVAVLDAVERYWANYPDDEYPNADTERLIEAGLVSKHVAEHHEQRRKAEKGKMIVRDPVARLRRKHPEPE
jgi:hypothetical protein